MGYLLLTCWTLWSRCFVQPRTTFNLVTLAEGNLGRSNPTIPAQGNLSMFNPTRQFVIPEPRPNVSMENKGLINWTKWIAYPPTHVLLKVNLSCTSLKTTKPWSRWLLKDEVPRWDKCRVVVWLDQLGSKNLNQICWHQKPTCWHSNQRKFLEKWVESPSVFTQYHVFFRRILLAIWKVLSLKPESALWLVPRRNEDKTQPRVMGLRWQKPDLPVWCCKASAKRAPHHKDRDLQSIRERTQQEKS